MPKRQYRLIAGTATWNSKELKKGDIITAAIDVRLRSKNKWELVGSDAPEAPAAPKVPAEKQAETPVVTPEGNDSDAAPANAAEKVVTPVTAEEILVPVFEKSSPKIVKGVEAMLGNLKNAGISTGEELAAFLEASEDPIIELTDFDDISKATAKKIVAAIAKGTA